MSEQPIYVLKLTDNAKQVLIALIEAGAKQLGHKSFLTAHIAIESVESAPVFTDDKAQDAENISAKSDKAAKAL